LKKKLEEEKEKEEKAGNKNHFLTHVDIEWESFGSLVKKSNRFIFFYLDQIIIISKMMKELSKSLFENPHFFSFKQEQN